MMRVAVVVVGVVSREALRGLEAREGGGGRGGAGTPVVYTLFCALNVREEAAGCLWLPRPSSNLITRVKTLNQAKLAREEWRTREHSAAALSLYMASCRPAPRVPASLRLSA